MPAPSPIPPLVGPVDPFRRLRADLVLLRAAPLSPGEHRAVADLGLRWSKRRWRHIRELAVAAVDGQGDTRAWLGFAYLRADTELAELTEICRMLEQLRRAVPEAELRMRDDAALFALESDRFVVAKADAEPLPPLPTGWALSEDACLSLPPDLAAAPPAPSLPGPATDGEFYDLLDVIERAGPRPALLRAGTAPALRHTVRLHAMASSGVQGAACTSLMGELAGRELADLADATPAAQHLVLTGDAREREAARRLLAALEISGVVARTDPEAEWAAEGLPQPDWKVVRALGRDLLASPGLGEALPDEDAPQDWEDDLELDDLLLVVDEDVELPDTAISRAIGRFRSDPRLDTARALPLLPAFPEHALDLLRGRDSEVAGACLLVALGLWPAGRLPGLSDALSAIAHSLRPTPVRVLAVRALARTGRPDLAEVLLELAEDDPQEVAGEALRGLAGVPRAVARRTLREATTRPHLAAYAVVALAEARDVGAFTLVRDLAESERLEVRQAVARCLDAIGGSRAETVLARLYDADRAWEVRLEAASALTRLARSGDLGRLLDDPDAELRARALRAAGRSQRGEAYGQILRSCTSIHPEVRDAAAQALGGLGLSGATPALLGLLDDPVERVVLSALDAMVSCADRRALPALRVLASGTGPVAEAALRVLRTGRCLRLPPAEPRIRIRGRSTEVLSEVQRQRLRRAFSGSSLRLDIQDRGFTLGGRLDADDGEALVALVQAIDVADTQVHGLRWSVRDGQCAIRRDRGTWLLSRIRGEVVRDAGWFELPAPPNEPRLPLSPLTEEERDPAGLGPLPISVGADRPTVLEPVPEEEEHTVNVAARVDPAALGPRDHDTDDVRAHELRTATMLVDMAPSPHLTGPLRDELSAPPEDAEETGAELTLSRWLEEVTAATHQDGPEGDEVEATDAQVGPRVGATIIPDEDEA